MKPDRSSWKLPSNGKIATGLLNLCWIFSGGEEVGGVYLYALAPCGVEPLQPSSTAGPVLTAEIVELGEWVVWIFNVPFQKLLDQSGILELFQGLCRQLLANGAVVVWIGGEDSTWNPSILDPGRSDGNVVAAAFSGSGLLVNQIGDQFDYLANPVLERVWASVCDLGFSAELCE
jgi:hypothetical protein